MAPPAAVFAPLLTESLNGFAILDSRGYYVYASASLCNLLSLSKDVLLGRAVSELVLPADRAALRELLDDARRAAREARCCESFVQLRHACGDAIDWQPVELKACTDGEYVYCVLLDARVPARLESVLPHFLLSTSHDLRTPCCSVQAATALLLSLPAVAADGEACSLLHTVDASCEALLRCVSNVLQMRQLQRAGPLLLQLPPPRVFDLVTCVRRVMNMAAALDCAQPRLLWDASATARRLPPRVLGDEASVTACLQNVLLTAMLWLPRDAPVHLRLATEATAAAHVGVRATMQPPPVDAATGFGSVSDLTFVVTVETPGRALTPHEVASILEPFSMLPVDKGGGTGLALYVTQGLARAMGGVLEIQPGRHEGTVLRLLLPLRVPAGDAPPNFEAEAAAEGPTEAPPPPSPHLPSPRTAREAHEGTADELLLTSRMFECLLINSDDVFVHCRITTQGEDAILATIEYISPSVSSRLGFSQRDAVGLDILSVCHPEDHCAFLAAVRAAYDGSGPHAHHLMYVHRNLTASGGTVWCHTSGLCVGDELFLVCRDLRTIRSVELALRTFTLAMSHDMREPCNAILVAAAVLERRACVAAAAAEEPMLMAAPGRTSPPLDARTLVACIRSACSLLLGIVGNVLTAPQVEAGELTLQHNVFSPARLVEDVLQACRLGCTAVASGDGTSIELEEVSAVGGEALPSMVESDRNRLAQMVQNLVTNACKFGRGAPVRVQASLQRGAAGQTSLQVIVRDTGSGMSAEEATRCFAFEQAAPAAAGGGTGLGLYISNAFARLMGGTLSVQSELGKGSTFELHVPVRVLPPEEAAAAAEAATASVEVEAAAAEAAEESQRGRAASFAARAAAITARGSAQSAAAPVSPRPPESQQHRLFHVLVADDYALNLRLITRLLQVHDFNVTAVEDGAAALAALLASFAEVPPDADAAAGSQQQQQPFDVVVLDMDMPHLRGPQVAARFREWEAQERPHEMRLPIIALTANVLEEYAAECADAGMDLFFSKPLREADVAVLRAHAMAYAEQRALEALEAATLGAQPVVHAATARAHQAYRVLGLPVVVSAVNRGSPRTSVSSKEEEQSPREHAAGEEE